MRPDSSCTSFFSGQSSYSFGYSIPTSTSRTSTPLVAPLVSTFNTGAFREVRQMLIDMAPPDGAERARGIELDLCQAGSKAPVLSREGMGQLERALMFEEPPISLLKLGDVVSMEFFLKNLADHKVETIDLRNLRVCKPGEKPSRLANRHIELLSRVIQTWPGGNGLKRLVIDDQAYDPEMRQEELHAWQEALRALQAEAEAKKNRGCFQIELKNSAAHLGDLTAEVPISERPFARPDQETAAARDIARLLEEGNAQGACQLIVKLPYRLTTLNLVNEPRLSEGAIQGLVALMGSPPGALEVIKVGKAATLLPLLEALPESKLTELDLTQATVLVFDKDVESETSQNFSWIRFPGTNFSFGGPNRPRREAELTLRPQHLDVFERLRTTEGQYSRWRTRVLVNSSSLSIPNRQRLSKFGVPFGEPAMAIFVVDPALQAKASNSGRAKCDVLNSKLYPDLVRIHFQPDSLQTLTPMMNLDFLDGYDQPGAGDRHRERALELLTERLTKIDPRYTWKDLPGIKQIDLRNEKQVVPTLQINYQPKFAEFLAHTLGFCIGKFNERYDLSRCNPAFLRDADIVGDELSDLWQMQAKSASLSTNIPLSGDSVFNLSASRTVYASAVSALMQQNFIVGEYHGSPAGRNFILQNMENFKKAGFTTCYIEMLPIELQSHVDAYLGDNREVPMSLELDLYSYGARCKEVLVAAKEIGIRVIGVDSGFARRDGKLPDAPFNHMLLSLIESDCKNRNGGKFFGLTGAAHAGDQKDIVGVTRMINDCKSVFVHQFDDPDKKAKEFIMFSLDRRNEFPKEHPCASFFAAVDCDLYIASRDPFQMSIDHDNSKRVHVPHGERPHQTERFRYSKK